MSITIDDAGFDVSARDALRSTRTSDGEGRDMFLTVFLILPTMSLLSTLSRSTARTFTRAAVNRTPAVFARGEHTLPKLPYSYDVSLDPRSPSLCPMEAMLIRSEFVARLGP